MSRAEEANRELYEIQREIAELQKQADQAEDPKELETVLGKVETNIDRMIELLQEIKTSIHFGRMSLELMAVLQELSK